MTSSKLYSSTRIKSNHFHFEWTISDFSILKEAGFLKHLRSEPFHVKIGDDNTTWRIEICYPGRSANYTAPDHLSFYLKYYRSDKGEKRYVIKKDSYILKSQLGNDDCAKHSTKATIYEKRGLGYPRFITMEKLESERSDFLPNDTMTLICKGDVMMGVETGQAIPTVAVKESRLSSDYQHLLDSGEGKDATLIAEGKEVPVHRLVLQARSPVFAAMFTHDTLEKHTGKVVLNDVDSTVLEAMVHFLYTDQEPPNLPEVATELMVAADKYDLTRLNTMCESHLAGTLNLDNVMSRLNSAILHNCPKLMEVCLIFAKHHLEKLRRSPSWPKMFLLESSEAMLALLKPECGTTVST